MNGIDFFENKGGGTSSATSNQKQNNTKTSVDFFGAETKKTPSTSNAPISNTSTPKVIYTSKNGTAVTQDDLNKWVDPTYKLSKQEKKLAKETKKANFNYKTIDSLAYDDQVKYTQLDNKLRGVGVSFGSGLTKGIVPFVDTVEKGIVKSGFGDDADAVLDQLSYRDDLNKQHFVSNGAGRFLGSMLNYSNFKQIPAVGKVAEKVGGALGGGTVAKGIGNITADTLVDLALDTAPEAINNIVDGKSGGEVAKDVAKNIGTNIAFNIGGEFAPGVIKAFKGDYALEDLKNVVDPNMNLPIYEGWTSELLSRAGKTINNAINNGKAAREARNAKKAARVADSIADATKNSDAVADAVKQTEVPKVEPQYTPVNDAVPYEVKLKENGEIDLDFLNDGKTRTSTIFGDDVPKAEVKPEVKPEVTPEPKPEPVVKPKEEMTPFEKANAELPTVKATYEVSDELKPYVSRYVDEGLNAVPVYTQPITPSRVYVPSGATPMDTIGIYIEPNGQMHEYVFEGKGDIRVYKRMSNERAAQAFGANADDDYDGMSFGDILDLLDFPTEKKWIAESIPTLEKEAGTVVDAVKQTDIPKADIPKADVPKADLPEADVPKTDIPKVEETKPKFTIEEPPEGLPDYYPDNTPEFDPITDAMLKNGSDTVTDATKATPPSTMGAANVMPTTTPTTTPTPAQPVAYKPVYKDSKMITNGTLNRNGILDMESETGRQVAKYREIKNSESVAQATQRLSNPTDYKYWNDKFISGSETISSPADVDTAMMLLNDKKNKITELENYINNGGTDTEEAKQLLGDLTVERDILARRLRGKGTSDAQALQSLAKWNHNADGAIVNSERLLDERAKSWSKSNGKKSQAIDAETAKLIDQMNPPKEKLPANSTLRKALDGLVNKDTFKKVDGVPKTHADYLKEVKGTFEKELSSFDANFTDTDYEVLAIFLENKVSAEEISDELAHRLKYGTWYTLDESIPIPKEIDAKVQKALDGMFTGFKKNGKTEITHNQLVENIKNTFEKEFGSIDNLTDNDFEVLAIFRENGMDVEDLALQIKNKLATGEWLNVDESIAEVIKPNATVNSALRGMLGDNLPKDATELSKAELRKQIRASFDGELGSTFDDITDDDIEYVANLIENGIKKEELADFLKTRASTGKWNIDQSVVEEVNNIFKLADVYNIDSKDRVELENQAFALLANNIYGRGGTGWEKFDQWRYLAMLGNTKTHMRNLVSNALFGAVTGASNTMAGAMESLVDTASKTMGGKGIERTKSVLNPVSDGSFIQKAFRDADEHSYRQLTGSKYSTDLKRTIESKKKVFKSNIMNTVSEGNTAMLELEDLAFNKVKYSTSLAGYLKANGLDESVFDAERRLIQLGDQKIPDMRVREEVEELKRQVDILNKGREYAVKQAQYSTFHEDNTIAEAITKFQRNARNSDSKGVRVVGKLTEGVVPFAKTPANILRSGLEYSPLGIVRDIGDVGALIKGNINAAQFVENLSKTLTGSSLFLLGWWLYDRGALSASSDAVTGSFDANQGKQAYALKLGNKTYTIDFAVPSAMPLLVGAEVAKNIGQDGFQVTDFNALVNSLTSIAEPITDTSMLSGVNDTIQALKNSDNPIGTLAFNSLLGYFTQAVPTALGQVARTIDNTRRSTYSSNEGTLGTLDKQKNKLLNKIPFASKTNEAYVDLWGREQANGPDGIIPSLAYQMLSPSYVSTINTTPVDAEIQSLYDSTKEKTVLPKYHAYQIDGEKMSEAEQYKYSKINGETRYDLIESLIDTDVYKNSDDSAKVELIGEMYTLAGKVAKYGVTGDDSKEKSKLYGAYTDGGVQGVMDYLTTENKLDEFGYSMSNKTALEIYSQYGDYGLEVMRNIKSLGTTKKDVLQSYLDNTYMSDAQKKYFFSMFNSGSNPYE